MTEPTKKPSHNIIAFVPLGFNDKDGNEVTKSFNIAALWRNTEKETTTGEIDLSDLPRRAGDKFRVAIVKYKEKEKVDTATKTGGDNDF